MGEIKTIKAFIATQGILNNKSIHFQDSGQAVTNIYFVHLCYYRKYYQTSFKFIDKLRYGLRGEPVIIINNNQEDPFVHPQAIKGNNNHFEFSGWEQGRRHLLKHMTLADDDVIVFSNDTINSHRYFTWFDRWLFTKAIKRSLLIKKPFILGDYYNLPEPGEILSLPIAGWISTYLFATNGLFLKQLDCFHIHDDKACSIVSASEKNISFSSAVSHSIARHITKWFSPEKGKHGWYKAKTASIDFVQKKALSILNEKRLSALCVNQGGVLISVYEGKLIKKYKRWARRKFRRLKRNA